MQDPKQAGPTDARRVCSQRQLLGPHPGRAAQDRNLNRSSDLCMLPFGQSPRTKSKVNFLMERRGFSNRKFGVLLTEREGVDSRTAMKGTPGIPAQAASACPPSGRVHTQFLLPRQGFSLELGFGGLLSSRRSEKGLCCNILDLVKWMHV